MGSFSIWHWLIVLLIVVMVFGTKKLKNMGSDLGGAVKGFKDGIRMARLTLPLRPRPPLARWPTARLPTRPPSMSKPSKRAERVPSTCSLCLPCTGA